MPDFLPQSEGLRTSLVEAFRLLIRAKDRFVQDGLLVTSETDGVRWDARERRFCVETFDARTGQHVWLPVGESSDVHRRRDIPLHFDSERLGRVVRVVAALPDLYAACVTAMEVATFELDEACLGAVDWLVDPPAQETSMSTDR